MTDNGERYINPYIEQAEIAKYSEAERRQYFESQKEYWDYFSTMQTAHDKGRAEGVEIGRAEGVEIGRAEGVEIGRAEGVNKTNIDNACKMKAKGYDIDDIADITGLSKEEIERL